MKNLPAKTSRTGVYGRSRSILEARSRAVYQMTRRLIADMPWLERSDRNALRAWCEMEFLCASIWLRLDRGNAMFDAQGNVKRLAHDYRIFRQTQTALTKELGMTPVSRMALRASGSSPNDLVADFARAANDEKAK